MLKEVLEAIQESKIYSSASISRALDISPEMVQGLVEDLIRMGYLLEEIQSPLCETSCSKCPYARNCNTVVVKTYKISEKGERLLSK